MPDQTYNVVEDYLEVLQALESTIVALYADRPDLTDKAIDRALNSLVREFETQVYAKPVTIMRLSNEEIATFRTMHSVIETHFGEIDEANAGPAIACLTHVRRSIKFWTHKNGERGYLSFISKYNDS
jgi:hypothetical protein